MHRALNYCVLESTKFHQGFRVADAGDAIAMVSSGEHVVQGGLALVRVNKLGQVVKEIFNCTRSVTRIKKDSALGIIENKHSNEDSVGELNVNNLTAQLEEFKPKRTKTTHSRKEEIYSRKCSTECSKRIQGYIY